MIFSVSVSTDRWCSASASFERTPRFAVPSWDSCSLTPPRSGACRWLSSSAPSPGGSGGRLWISLRSRQGAMPGTRQRPSCSGSHCDVPVGHAGPHRARAIAWPGGGRRAPPVRASVRARIGRVEGGSRHYETIVLSRTHADWASGWADRPSVAPSVVNRLIGTAACDDENGLRRGGSGPSGLRTQC